MFSGVLFPKWQHTGDSFHSRQVGNKRCRSLPAPPPAAPRPACQQGFLPLAFSPNNPVQDSFSRTSRLQWGPGYRVGKRVRSKRDLGADRRNLTEPAREAERASGVGGHAGKAGL